MEFTTTPVLLMDADYCGTLAAARDLGRRGIQVWSASTKSGAPTAYSRYVARHWHTSGSSTPEALLQWLIQFGKQHTGTVLYPTSDDFAWLQATNVAALQPYFHMYSPDATVIEGVLDKRQLLEACDAVGIECPVSHFVESLDEVAAIAPRCRFPLVLKQRTQVFSLTHTKGIVVRTPDRLARTYGDFVAMNPHAEAVRARMQFASWPLMQEFHANATKGSYLVSGFVNRDQTRIVTRAAIKLLQYPRTLGIALCMETAPIDDALTQRILALCKRTGYFGVFQIEFLLNGDRKLLIDFNPRYYHYMAFDMARGLPLAWLAHLGACGDEAALNREIDTCSHSSDTEHHTFSYRLQLSELLWAQRLSGTMSATDFSHWRRWYRQHHDHMIDAVADSTDPRPELATAVNKMCAFLRHPRAFVRQIALDR
jgi:D-aspartate ligase